MPILHAVQNIGNQGMKLSRAQRRLGYVSDCMDDRPHAHRTGEDFNLHLERYSGQKAKLMKLQCLVRLAPRYDVFHFHGSTFMPMMLDIPLLKALGKVVVMHYHGADLIRTFDAERARLLYGWLGGPQRGRDLVYGRIGSRIANQYADAILVSEPDLLAYVPSEAQWLPQPLDLQYWEPAARKKRTQREVIVVHAPTNREKKGTKYVIEAVDSLAQEGHNVRLLLVENTPYEQVRVLCQQADIFVDQLICGWYGNACCEAMAMEKPVCVYIQDDLAGYLGSCPIVNCTPANLKDNLKMLIEQPEMRTRLGQQGRSYVSDVHDAMALAKRCIEIYLRATERT